MKVTGLVVIALLLCGLSMSVFGQVSLQFNDFPYTAGSVLTRSMGSNFNVMTAAGPDQDWDFSQSVTVLDFIENFDDPNGHPGADSFPTATHVMFSPEDQEPQQLTYLQYSGTVLTTRGTVFVIGEDTIIIPAEMTGYNADFPMQYGDEWDYVSVTDYNDVETTVEAHNHVDAWGTVTDITGTFECLRLRVERTKTEVPGETESHIEYYWYAPDHGEVVATFSNHDDTDPLFESGSFMRISDIQTVVIEQDPSVVRSFTLQPAYPNPFNASTTLEFTLPATDVVKIVVLNTLGQQVAQVADGIFASGPHQLTIDADGLSSGMYFVRLTSANQHAQMQRITLLK